MRSLRYIYITANYSQVSCFHDVRNFPRLIFPLFNARFQTIVDTSVCSRILPMVLRGSFLILSKPVLTYTHTPHLRLYSHNVSLLPARPPFYLPNFFGVKYRCDIPTSKTSLPLRQPGNNIISYNFGKSSSKLEQWVRSFIALWITQSIVFSKRAKKKNNCFVKTRPGRHV